MDRPTLDYYAAHSRELAVRYGAVAGGVSDYFDEAFSGFHRVLDAGCGTGRDLVRLLRRGHDAAGADACPEMVDIARKACREAGFDAAGRVLPDALPHLASFPDGSCDGVLCSAVLMHLPDQQLFDAVYALRRILRLGGRLLLSIPARRTDVDPETRRDPHGRYFADLPPARLRLLLERVGFRLLWRRESDDAQGRPDTRWTTFLFEWPGADAERPLDQVESILNRDKKDATYKLALFRALAEIAQTQYHVAVFDRPGKVGIPIRALAEKWLAYYWPIVASESFIAQKNGESPDSAKPMAIRKPLQALIRAFGPAGGLPAFRVALKSGGLPAHVVQVHRAVLRKIESTIWTMPVRYAGGGEEFSVFQYDKATRLVLMPEELWRELTLTGSWIHDATVLRWAELTERLSKGMVPVSLIVEKLLAIADPGRETSDARTLYDRIGIGECVWTAKPLRGGFDVDHVIPFALWRNNDLWNLLPARPEANNAKRDRLPTQRLLHHRRDAVIACWELLREHLPDRFEREAAALCGLPRLRNDDWRVLLFSRLAEAVEITAVQRRVPRWEPAGIVFPAGTVLVDQAVHRPAPEPPEQPEFPPPTPALLSFDDVRAEAYTRFLPLIGALAAGQPFSGFDIADLESASDCPWIEVPPRLAGPNRFVIQIAGDSMEPELRVGDLAVFEYHRTPRAENQIVIANLPEFGLPSDLATTDAVKRLRRETDAWIFQSTNPNYDDLRIPAAECRYPILGILVGRV